MESQQLRQRVPGTEQPKTKIEVGAKMNAKEIPHPAGEVKFGLGVQGLRMVAFTLWFSMTCLVVHFTQLIGSPLYFINRDWFYAYMALTKQSFGIILATITQWFSPTVVRVSGDKSVAGQLKLTPDGRLETQFPERLVMIANHQLYTDWLYLWWVSYTSRMHGHIFIVLKQSLKYVPVIGPGMMYYGFIFMARNWAKDRKSMQHRLQQLTTRHGGPMSGTGALDPMWLLIFPEGTNLSANTRKESAEWAEKQGVKDLRHQVIPRTTGLLYTLTQLKGSVDWVYDCTMAYEGIPKGGYGSEIFTLRSTYFQGRPPKSVNMYWRRFAMSSIPIDDPKAFEKWVTETWKTKDEILEHFAKNGRFPADESAVVESKGVTEAADGSKIEKIPGSGTKDGYLETEVRLQNNWEVGQVFVVPAALWGAWRLYLRAKEVSTIAGFAVRKGVS